jgi:hypothetical protein
MSRLIGAADFLTGSLRSFDRFQPARPLDAVHVRQELRWRQRDLGVAQARVPQQGRRPGLAGVDAVLHSVGVGLTGEDVDHRIDGFGLVLLDLELELHRVRSP